MSEMQNFFQMVDYNVWGDSWFKWVFYMSLILILILEKRKEIKIVFVIYTIALHLLIFNPISYKAVHIFFSGEYLAYYSRLFEMIPIVFCTAQGLLLLVMKVKTGWQKLLLVCFFSALILWVGADANSFNMSWMKPACNLQKVPAGLIEICDAVNDEQKSVCVAAPSELSGYIRQVDAALFTPYGRYVSDLGTALDERENPDIDFIMKTAGQADCDYIIAFNNEDIRAAYSEAGKEPDMETDQYLVFEVEGVPRVERVFNEKRQMIAKSNYDEQNNLIPFDNDGYCTICYEYDADGNPCKEYYLDSNGKKMVLPRGYAMIERTYHHISGLIDTVVYEDTEGNPVDIADGYSMVKNVYSGRKLENEIYYDQAGNVV